VQIHDPASGREIERDKQIVEPKTFLFSSVLFSFFDKMSALFLGFSMSKILSKKQILHIKRFDVRRISSEMILISFQAMATQQHPCLALLNELAGTRDVSYNVTNLVTVHGPSVSNTFTSENRLLPF